MYNESYVRTSSSKYEEYNPNISNEEQIFMQLTNNAIQKHGEEYGKYEEGNIMSTYAMFQYISTLK
jgi:tubulin--tyrosine ligase